MSRENLSLFHESTHNTQEAHRDIGKNEFDDWIFEDFFTQDCCLQGSEQVKTSISSALFLPTNTAHIYELVDDDNRASESENATMIVMTIEILEVYA